MPCHRVATGTAAVSNVTTNSNSIKNNKPFFPGFGKFLYLVFCRNLSNPTAMMMTRPMMICWT